LAALSAFLGLVYLLVDLWTEEPPNYTLIEDGLYVGGYVERPPPRTTVVLNLCEIPDQYESEIHVWESIRDGAPTPTLDWLRRQVDLIDRHRRAGRVVYVHCRNGVSRSGMVVTAYLMTKHNWPRDRALEFIRARRPIVRPNPAFMNLLNEWERATAPRS
jgi:hypothetical protein